MSNYTSYPWAVLYGFYFYIIFQIVFLLRFGSINMNVSVLDAFLVLNGILSVLMLMWFANKLPRKKGFLFIPFGIALPFSMIGALGGGLLGWIGILIGGLVPFVIAIPIGYFLIKKLAGGSTIAPPATPTQAPQI